MSEALTKYLKDFSQFVPAEEPAPLAIEMPALSLDDDWAIEPEPAVDIEEEKRKAAAKAEEVTQQKLRAEHEAELEALKAQHQQELEAQRVRFEEEIAGHLATSVISMKQAIASNVEDACFKLFANLMERDTAERAASELSQQVLREIEGGFAGTIRISGPDRLLTKMREDLRDVDNHVDYDASDDIDIQVQMDSSVLMTRLAEFFQTLRGLSDE